MQPMNRRSLARLIRIEHGRLVEPLLFGGLSPDQGISRIRRRNAVYLMAVDENQQPSSLQSSRGNVLIYSHVDKI